jgi:hypothetical protein
MPGNLPKFIEGCGTRPLIPAAPDRTPLTGLHPISDPATLEYIEQEFI